MFILVAVGALQPSHGWSIESLRRAANVLSLSPAVVAGIQRGEGELVEDFVRKCNSELAEKLDAEMESGALAQLSTTEEKLGYAICERLKMIRPHIKSWPQAMKVQAYPQNLPHTLSNAAELMDEIWHACGCSAVDFKWYVHALYFQRRNSIDVR